MTAILQVEDLHLWYSAGDRVVRAVDGVSFALAQRGEALGVVGESGSGKSSLALALMRMLPKNVARFDGSIKLDGRELTTLSLDSYRREIRWRKIAMVFQGAMSVLASATRSPSRFSSIAVMTRTPRGPASRSCWSGSVCGATSPVAIRTN